MSAVWDFADFDDHEHVHMFRDRASGLTAVIAVHSTHLGPGAGGVRYWHYPQRAAAITDALRLSRGMSYKNAMAGLPMGGGKGVILADENGAKTPELLAAFGRAVDSLGGAYVTAEDVGITDADMVEIAKQTKHVSGLPVASGEAGGDPGPFTALGVYLGIKAAIREGLGTDSAAGVRVAIQGVGSVGGGVARRLAAEGAKLTLADVNLARAKALAEELGAELADSAAIMEVEADVLSPNALGAILTERSIEKLRVPIIAGGANNQLATAADGQRVHDRGIVYAPDYVINAGGIINVALEYLGQGSREEVESRIHLIPGRLAEIWAESKASGTPASVVADRMAQKLIGRG
ncbi:MULTISPECIES: Glu/Leu/Phe/Val dehydrogenase dimerization domain-containing protein [unclassified Sphingopyxis]|uniref:Glu/Leu/Phe/Val family dehydrogenase n=1 Tax=unclassified Sphingopyxis TaxID=2614943 RepID=UPI00073077EF|nr:MULTISPECIES: Glu/Leu/Phe/Val dehydrogenase dimerization domain-containing protein [unclassified Sphingopyxis]KTE25193.1 amino acid dehydrogenase [Sphingopyxis sp. H057]KTE53763.1 amino acid dehydrogenase [Sphingopyxis sp. H073]KTE56355.1 amino acid dehydrogenase [Sphingopyxis sp. H071]KTE62048.1 amino acid dehydrogenase [Sphingopyxis sp. H107]KTE66619.1 amino acid dehydrogenase [Sphingopyxis sp. H081]